MNENKKIARLFVFLTVIIAVVAVIFQCILYNNYLEFDTGVYVHGAKTPGAFYFFIFVSVVLMMTPALVFRKDLLPKDLKRGSFLTSITSILSAGAAVFIVVAFFMKKNVIMALMDPSLTSVEKLKLACVIIAVLVSVYYFAVAFSGKTKSGFISFLSFFPVIWILLFLMCLYFDRSGVLNSPVKELRQVALILFMLYALFETRASLGRSKPIIYFILSNLTVIFLSAAFIPEIILIFQGVLGLKLDSVFSIYCGVSLLYVLSRSIDFAESSNGNIVYKKNKHSPKTKSKGGLFNPDEDAE